MSAQITFLIFWAVFIVTGTVGSLLMHSDMSAQGMVNNLINHDMIYILLIGWALSGAIIVGLYLKSLIAKMDADKRRKAAEEKKKKEEEEKRLAEEERERRRHSQ